MCLHYRIIIWYQPQVSDMPYGWKGKRRCVVIASQYVQSIDVSAG